MAGSQLIGLIGHPEARTNYVSTFERNTDTFDWFARSGSLFTYVDSESDLRELRRNGGIAIAIVTSNIPPATRWLAEYADRTITTRGTDHARFAKVVHETIYGRPPVNRDNPREYRPL